MTKPSVYLALAATLLIVHSSGAQPAAADTTAKGRAAEAEPGCTKGQRSALSELACELAGALGTVPPGALVVAAPVRSDAKLETPEALGERVASVVAGALQRGARASKIPAGLTRARTLAAAAGTLIHLQVEIAVGELRMVADVYPVPKNFWDRVRDPKPSPTAHAFASRRLDAEVRTFLPHVPLVAKQVLKARSSERRPVALGCGDVDDDGSLELVLVGRRRIQLGRIRDGQFVAHAKASWTELSPVAQTPLREPLGAVVITPGKHIDIGISDRARAIRFDPSLTPIASSGRRIPWPGGGCSRLDGLVLAPTLEPCHEGDAEPPLKDFGWATDTVSGKKLVDQSGKPRLVRAGRIAGEPVALLRDDAGRSVRIEGVGAQLAVGDVDGDGRPELISGANTLEPRGDALIVHSWLDDGRVQERLRLAVPSGVYAIAVCPAESTGLAPIALATRREIWIVR